MALHNYIYYKHDDALVEKIAASQAQAQAQAEGELAADFVVTHGSNSSIHSVDNHSHINKKKTSLKKRAIIRRRTTTTTSQHINEKESTTTTTKEENEKDIDQFEFLGGKLADLDITTRTTTTTPKVTSTAIRI